MSGRTTALDDPVMGPMSGLVELPISICLDINEVVEPATIDGVHFEPESLQPVESALAKEIRSLFHSSDG